MQSALEKARSQAELDEQNKAHMANLASQTGRDAKALSSDVEKARADAAELSKMSKDVEAEMLAEANQAMKARIESQKGKDDKGFTGISPA